MSPFSCSGDACRRTERHFFGPAAEFRLSLQTLLMWLLDNLFCLFTCWQFLRLLWKSLLVIPVFSLELNQSDGFKAGMGRGE